MPREISGLGKLTKINSLEKLKDVDRPRFLSKPVESEEIEEGEKEKPTVFKFPEKAKREYLEWMERDGKKSKREKKDYLDMDKVEDVISKKLKYLPGTLKKGVSSANYALDYVRSEIAGPGSKKIEELLTQNFKNLNSHLEIVLQEALDEQPQKQILSKQDLVDSDRMKDDTKEKSEEKKETEKRIAVSIFLWGDLKSAIKERFGAGISFKRCITDDMANRFIKELGEFFYINEKGFVKSKKGFFNEFTEEVKKFEENYLVDVDNAIEKTKKAKEKEKERITKIKESGELRKRKFLEKYPVGSSYHDESNNILAIEGYNSALKSSDDRIEISHGINGFMGDTKEVSRKEFFEMIKVHIRDVPVGADAKEKEEIETRDEMTPPTELNQDDADGYETEQEFTEKEMQAIKIFEDGATDFVKRLKEESNWDGYSDEDKENTIRIQSSVFLIRQFRKKSLFSENYKEIFEKIFSKIKK